MTKSFRVKANLEVSFEVNSNVAKNSTYIEKLAKANLRKAVSANSFNLAVTEVDDAAIIELYKKHGKEICRRILHSKNNLGRSVKLTSEEINEAVNAFSFDFGKLYAHELYCSAYRNIESIAKESIEECGSYYEGKLFKDDLMDCVELEKLGKKIIDVNDDSYILLSTGKVIWYSLELSDEEKGVNSKYLPECY